MGQFFSGFAAIIFMAFSIYSIYVYVTSPKGKGVLSGLEPHAKFIFFYGAFALYGAIAFSLGWMAWQLGNAMISVRI